MTAAKLRFKEFDENWRLLTLKQLINSLDAGVSVISEDIMPLDDEYSVLKTSCISLGYFNKDERKRVLKSKQIQRLKEPVLDDSILISRMNTPLLVGMNAYVYKAPANTFLPDRLWQIKINNDLVMTLWLSFYLGSDGCLYKLRGLASGTSNSMKNITKPGVLSINLFVPSKEEQTKIASFLSAVDDKIAQLTQEHELLSEYKKGIIQQIFSQKLRFKADDGSGFEDWKKRKLGDVCNFINGRAYKKSEWEKEGVPVIRLQNLTGSGKEYYYSNLTLPSHQYCDEGDLLYMWSATFGPVFWQGKKAIFHYHIWKIKVKSLVMNKTYMYYLLDEMTEEMKKSLNGSTMLHVTKSGMEKTVKTIPSLPEQIKIANFLSAIDQKIDNVAAQIDQAKVWKKGLLQQMFV